VPAGKQILGKLKLATGFGFTTNGLLAWFLHPLSVVTDKTTVLFPEAAGV
jgi:hypothetical protein